MQSPFTCTSALRPSPARPAANEPSSAFFALDRIAHDPGRMMAAARVLLVLAALAMGAGGIRIAVESVQAPAVYVKDFVQEYVLAKAVLNGDEAYQPIRALSSRYVGAVSESIANHPTPHPPFVGLVFLPFGLLTYERAAALWLLLELALLAGSVAGILRHLNCPRPGVALLVAGLLLASAPVQLELVWGQLMILLLYLLVQAWRDLGAGRETRAGVWIGLIVALKLMAWPILLYLLLRRKGRAVIAAGVVAALANLAAAAVLGVQQVVGYYTSVAPQLMGWYQADYRSISVMSLGWRLLAGTTDAVGAITAPPVVQAAPLAQPFSIALLLLLLVAGLVVALKARSLDAAFGILVCVTTIASPVAWSHYLVILLIPLAVVGSRLYRRGLPPRATLAMLAVLLMLFVSGSGICRQLMIALYGQGPQAVRPIDVPPGIALLTFVPALAVLGLLWLVWVVDASPRAPTPSP